MIKKFKKFIVSVLILLILFQSFPLHAQAFSITGILNWILKKITLPTELKLTEGGSLVFGRNTLIKCVWTQNGKCVNPFSTISLGKDQTELRDEKGRPLIPRFTYPEICKLRIIPGPSEEPLTKKERIALSRACSDFIRIEKEAGRVVYAAKQLFNQTDPLSECFFAKNCKTSCSIAFGKITYTISALDIIKALNPFGLGTLILKVVNVARKLNQVVKIYKAIKTFVNDGIVFINQIFKNFSYLSTFYSAFKNLLHIEGFSGFSKLLKHYSDNLLKYSQAKSEAIMVKSRVQKMVNGLAFSLKNIRGVKFLYQNDPESKDRLRKLQEQIIDPYLLNIETPLQLFYRLKEIEKPLTPYDERILSSLPYKKTFSCPAGAFFTGETLKTPQTSQDSTSFYYNFRCREFVEKNPPSYARESWECSQGFYPKCGESPTVTPWTLETTSQERPADEDPLCPFEKYVNKRELSVSPSGITPNKNNCDDVAIDNPPVNFYCTPAEYRIVNYSGPEHCTPTIDNNSFPATLTLSCPDNLITDEGDFDPEEEEVNVNFCLRQKPYIEPLCANWNNQEGDSCSISFETINEDFYICTFHPPSFERTLDITGDFRYKDFVFYHPSTGKSVATITVNQRKSCEFQCVQPNSNWLNLLYEIASTTTFVEEYFNLIDSCENADSCPFFENKSAEIIAYLQEINSKKSQLRFTYSSLPVIEKGKEQYLWEAEGERKYWTTQGPYSVEGETVEEAEKQALNFCNYNPSLPYFDWESKIKAILQTNFKLVSEGLGRTPQTTREESFNYLKNFLQIPIINSALDYEKEKLSSYPDLQDKILQIQEAFSRINNIWTNPSTSTFDQVSFVEDILKTKYNSEEIRLIVEEIESLLEQLPEEEISDLKETLITGENSVKKFVGEKSCPDPQNPQGFLGGLACFEVENKRTFEEISLIAQAIAKTREIVQKLDELDNLISQLKPSLDIPSLQISGDFDQMISGNIQFTGGNLFENPLKNLDDTFAEIKNVLEKSVDFIDNVKTLLEAAQKIASQNNFLGNEPLEFDEQIEKTTIIRDKITEDLNPSIFGNEEMRPGCQAIRFLFQGGAQTTEENAQEQGNVQIIEETCKDVSNGGELKSRLIHNPDINKSCQTRDILLSCLYTAGYTVEDLLEVFYSDDSETNLINWWKDHIGINKVKLSEGDYEITCAEDLDSEDTEWIKVEDAINLLSPDSAYKKTCEELDYQKALDRDCMYYNAIKSALQNNCHNNHCERIKTSIDIVRDKMGWQEMPDLTNPGNSEELKRVNYFCEKGKYVTGIKTPLDEVMKVYSILLGVKSGTLLYRGVKTSTEEAKKLYANAKKIITMIKSLPEKLKESYDIKVSEKAKSGGLTFAPPRCIANPATGWNKTTGPSGGMVCPNIDSLFARIEAAFAIMRQRFHHLDLMRKTQEHWNIKIGNIRISLLKTYPKYCDGDCYYYKLVDDLYNKAKSIKEKTQNVWALATAINFANQNFTCGKSLCYFPLCISGIPLTPSALTNPYGFIIFLLRHPLLRTANGLSSEITG